MASAIVEGRTGRFLPLLPEPRAVDPHWKCVRDGACCTDIQEVVMTKEEAAVLVHNAPPEIVMHFRPVDEHFVALKAKPCPLYAFSSCLVYAVRPYACRRFACLRPDVRAEPFEPAGTNMSDRTQTSRVARRMMQRIQNKAMGWAQAHGWKKV